MSRMPLQARLAPISRIDPEARTAEIVWSTGADVQRYDWMNDRRYIERLSLEPSAVRMERLKSGKAPLLNSHDQYDLSSVIGVVEGASLSDGEGLATVRFSRRDDVEPIFRDVQDKIVCNVSVGYAVHKYRRIAPKEDSGDPWIYEAIDWEPMELSFVPIGADPNAGTRQQQRSFECEFIDAAPAAHSVRTPAMTDAVNNQAAGGNEAQGQQSRSPDDAAARATQEAIERAAQQARDAAVREERERITEIRTAVRAARLGDAVADDFIARGVSIDEVRRDVLTRLAQQSAQHETRSSTLVQTVVDEQEVRREAIAEAVLHRADPSQALPDRARQYRGLTLVELARRSLEQQGVRTVGMTRSEVASLAVGVPDMNLALRFGPGLVGTSDFSYAMASTVARRLRQMYDAAPRTFQMWAVRGTLPDFRASTRVQAAADMRLEKVNENGEFKRGKLSDAGESIQLATYGKIIGITRQAIVNDDLQIFTRIPQFAAQAAADFESDTVYGVLTANPTMADGVALFHANHGNLGTGGAPSETTLSEMRTMMRKQTDIAGSASNRAPLNLVMRYLIIPAALETTVQKLLQATIVATKVADTNVFRNAFEVIVEPRLDAVSTTAWYAAADPARIDTVEYAYLDGQEGLYTEQRVGFDIDGIETKARLDFGVKALDWRGLFKNAGA